MRTVATFWPKSGYDLLIPERRDGSPHGRRVLVPTPEFLRAYLFRPEIAPVEESCAAERALHARMMADPVAPVPQAAIDAIADPDARENYTVLAGFFDRLAEAPTVEDAYLGLFTAGSVTVPRLFIDQLAQVIIQDCLIDMAGPSGRPDGMTARAAELFFRQQQVAIENGAILLADSETVDIQAKTGGFGDLGRLVAEAQTPLRGVELDVLRSGTAEEYWTRDEKHDLVLDLTHGRPGLDALSRLMERWIDRFLGLEVRVYPVQSIRDDKWVWHIGLDPEASAIMNALYRGEEVEEDRLVHILSLFRLEIRDTSLVMPSVAGRPVYLGLAMDEGGQVRFKPQNLLVNLPLQAQG